MQSRDHKIYSVIDLGTNTCLLLIATFRENKLIKLFEAQETPRLGKNLYETGKISVEAFPKTLEIIKHYISISKNYNAEKILSFGTSALRDAKNSTEFVEFIESEGGVRIKILSGGEEAKYSYAGAVFDLDENKEYVVLDIGGGSVEICYLDNGNVKSTSIDIGSVRIYEEFFKEKFNEQSIEAVRRFIVENINTLNLKIDSRSLVGVAGTMTTLSAIKNGLKDFDENIIHKDVLKLFEIKNNLDKLISMTDEERLNLGSYMKGRNDIIICGTMILIEVMDHFKISEVIVSTKGLRYGLFLNIPDFI